MAAISGMGTPGQNAQASTHLLKINISCPTPVISIQEKKKKVIPFSGHFLIALNLLSCYPSQL